MDISFSILPKIKDNEKINTTKKELYQFEIDYNLKLPDYYKLFLYNNGAGIPQPNIHYKDSSLNESDCIGLINIYSLSEIINSISEHCYESELEKINIIKKSKIIPIAQADMGLVCMCILGIMVKFTFG